MDELTPTKDDGERFFHAEHDSIVGYLTQVDHAWLEAALTNTTRSQRRAIALQALIRLWGQRGQIEAEADALREIVRDDVDLTSEISQRTRPVEPSEKLKKFEREQRRRRSVQERCEQQRLADWTKWRDALLADPATAFSPDNVPLTISNLHKWLVARNGFVSGYNVWDGDALTQAFGSDIAQRAEAAFQAFWRAEPPTLWSRRPLEKRNSISWVWLYAFCGVAMEAMSPQWATKLSPAEARIAAAYATVELNGFSSWIGDLADAHPGEVDSVLGAELTAEFAAGIEYPHLPVLQDLVYADIEVKRLLAPRLLAVLATWPSEFADEEAGRRSAHHLDQVLRILGETCESQDRNTVASECSAQFEAYPEGPLALVWLRGLFRFDPEQGALSLESGLAAIDGPGRAARAIEIFAALFGDRDGVLLYIADPSTRADILGRLVRCAYNYVRREDDQEHESSFSPNTRDNAETARSFLLSALLDTPGPRARKVLLELAVDPLFAHFPDRLRFLVRQRAASDAEPEPFSPADVVKLEARLEMPPHDRDGLFNVMMDRLDDLSHDIAHDDFTDRRTLRTIRDESEIQRTLARRLKDMARGAYVVVREDEVADLKRTDIRLAAVRGDQKAAIEVKIADRRWSVKDFERAMRNQLVGQYLRHENSKAGCLLLTYDGAKKYWKHPETGARLSFTATIDYLAGVARGIEQEMTYEVLLKVYGLDLTDPNLAPAHR